MWAKQSIRLAWGCGSARAIDNTRASVCPPPHGVDWYAVVSPSTHLKMLCAGACANAPGVTANASAKDITIRLLGRIELMSNTSCPKTHSQ
jgi:hypothetical protein